MKFDDYDGDMFLYEKLSCTYTIIFSFLFMKIIYKIKQMFYCIIEFDKSFYLYINCVLYYYMFHESMYCIHFKRMWLYYFYLLDIRKFVNKDNIIDSLQIEFHVKYIKEN